MTEIEASPIRVYIAAPYSSNPVEGTRRALYIGDRLLSHGFIPFIPHLSLFWDLIYPHPVEHWYEYDLEWLRQCHELIRLPGESKGADREVIQALSMGLKVWEGETDGQVLDRFLSAHQLRPWSSASDPASSSA